MKQYIATTVAAMALASSAQAESFFQIEAGIGMASFTTLQDGMYFQKGFSHHFDLHVPAGRVGIVMNAIDYRQGSVIPGLRIHADYMNFGSVHMTSDAAQDAEDFTSQGQTGGYDAATKGCYDNNCGAIRKFDSSGGLQLLAFTLEPYWQKGAWTFGVEFGPTLFRSTWTSTATVVSATSPWGPKGSVEVLQHEPHIQLGTIIGASIGYKAFSLRYNYVFCPLGSSTGKNVPAGFKGAHMLTLGYVW
ncbi:hypothetical protein PQQ75_25540 [Paraburkholderia aspalathi]|uniref:hypothetical protein n=1 Tax=Paraburkholderia aspalathi TaxID=1324617 RepID=UPI0038BD58C2